MKTMNNKAEQPKAGTAKASAEKCTTGTASKCGATTSKTAADKKPTK